MMNHLKPLPNNLNQNQFLEGVMNSREYENAISSNLKQLSVWTFIKFEFDHFNLGGRTRRWPIIEKSY